MCSASTTFSSTSSTRGVWSIVTIFGANCRRRRAPGHRCRDRDAATTAINAAGPERAGEGARPRCGSWRRRCRRRRRSDGLPGRGINRPLGLTVYCWRVRLDQSLESVSVMRQRRSVLPGFLRPPRGRGLGGHGPRRLHDDVETRPTSRARRADGRKPLPPIPRRAAEVYGERYRANPKDADAALALRPGLRANGQRAQAAAVLEQATIANPGNKALIGPTAARSPTTAISSRPSTCCSRRIRPTIRTGACSRCRGPRSIRWAVTRKRALYYASALQDRAWRSRRCSPISACPTCCRETCRRPKRRCGKPTPRRTQTPGCGRISVWSSVSRAASPKPRPS